MKKQIKEKHDIYGVNGSYADIHGAIEKHKDGGFVMYATIQDEITFGIKYIGYKFEDARKRFKKALQKETDSYFLGE